MLNGRQAEASHTSILVMINSDHCPLYDGLGFQRYERYARFAIEQGITYVPAVRFFDANGQLLTSDLVGAGLADFYLFYLESATSKAREDLKKSRAFTN